MFEHLIGPLSPRMVPVRDPDYHHRKSKSLAEDLERRLEVDVRGNSFYFDQAAWAEALQLREQSMGREILRTVGYVYKNYAQRSLGKLAPNVLQPQALRGRMRFYSDQAHRVNNMLSAVSSTTRLYVHLQTRKPEQPSVDRSNADEEETVTRVLEALWRVHRVDVELTVQRACKMVLRDPRMPPSVLKKRAEALMRLGRIFTAAAKGKNPDPGTFYSVENAPDPLASTGAAGYSQPAYGGGYGGGDAGFDVSDGHNGGFGFTARAEGWREGGGSAGGWGENERPPPPPPPPPPVSGSKDYEGERCVGGEAGLDGRLDSGRSGGGLLGAEKTFCVYDADDGSAGEGMGRSVGRRDDGGGGHEVALGGVDVFCAQESGYVEEEEDVLEPAAAERSWPPQPPDFPCRAHDDGGVMGRSHPPGGCDGAIVGGISGISGISGGSSLNDSHQGVPRNMDGGGGVRDEIGRGQERGMMYRPGVSPERSFFGRRGAAEDDWRDPGAGNP
ncbi:unnamed protein product [Ectocarpus fasciculatus]